MADPRTEVLVRCDRNQLEHPLNDLCRNWIRIGPSPDLITEHFEPDTWQSPATLDALDPT